MKIKFYVLYFIIACSLFFQSCTDIDDVALPPKLVIKFSINPNQARLDNNGNISAVPQGNAAQTPIFKALSSSYIELLPEENTQFGQGQIVYQGETTNAGGAIAIDFSKAKITQNGEVFLEIPLTDLPAGTYKWARASISYLNVQFYVRQIDQNSNASDYLSDLHCFIGDNTYISSFSIGNNFFDINSNKSQGFWAFALNDYAYSSSGQCLSGATTVPNPLFATSSIPQGSSVVTGKFVNTLTITGEEKTNVVITLSLSTNKCIEWQEIISNNKFDSYFGEMLVDTGIRGMNVTYTK